MLHSQVKVQSKILSQKLEATIVEADMVEIVAAHSRSSQAASGQATLAESVRPVATYWVILQ